MLFPLLDVATLSDEDLQKKITDLRIKMSQAGGAHSSATMAMGTMYQELMTEAYNRQVTKADKHNEDLYKKIDLS